VKSFCCCVRFGFFVIVYNRFVLFRFSFASVFVNENSTPVPPPLLLLLVVAAQRRRCYGDGSGPVPNGDRISMKQ